jgi:hypothetical protein
VNGTSRVCLPIDGLGTPLFIENYLMAGRSSLAGRGLAKPPTPEAGLRSILECNMYPTDEQIRERAHRLWVEAGKPKDREQEFWHQAERQLQVQSNQPNLPDNTG